MLDHLRVLQELLDRFPVTLELFSTHHQLQDLAERLDYPDARAGEGVPVGVFEGVLFLLAERDLLAPFEQSFDQVLGMVLNRSPDDVERLGTQNSDRAGCDGIKHLPAYFLSQDTFQTHSHHHVTTWRYLPELAGQGTVIGRTCLHATANAAVAGVSAHSASSSIARSSSPFLPSSVRRTSLSSNHQVGDPQARRDVVRAGQEPHIPSPSVSCSITPEPALVRARKVGLP